MPSKSRPAAAAAVPASTAQGAIEELLGELPELPATQLLELRKAITVALAKARLSGADVRAIAAGIR